MFLVFATVLRAEKPTITVYPQGSNGGLVRVRRGGTIEMNCMATGHPLPYLNWRRSSGQRLPAGRHQLQGGKLIITDVRIPDDVDQYECTATNTAGTASETRYGKFSFLLSFLSTPEQ